MGPKLSEEVPIEMFARSSVGPFKGVTTALVDGRGEGSVEAGSIVENRSTKSPM